MSSTPEDVVIYYNDLIDSDNWVAARFLEHAARKNPAMKIIWIIEPRQVAFGLSMTQQQITACTKLLKTYFPSYPNGFKALLGGLLKQDDLGRLNGVSQDDLDLVSPTMHSPGAARVLTIYSLAETGY
jgi:hypothetical protein